MGPTRIRLGIAGLARILSRAFHAHCSANLKSLLACFPYRFSTKLGTTHSQGSADLLLPSVYIKNRRYIDPAAIMLLWLAKRRHASRSHILDNATVNEGYAQAPRRKSDILHDLTGPHNGEIGVNKELHPRCIDEIRPMRYR